MTYMEEKGYHNHIVSEEEIKKAKFVAEITSLSETTQYKTSKVYSLASTKTNLHQLPIISKNTVYKNIQNIRKRHNIDINTNENLENSNINTNRGKKFCFYDSGSQSSSRIIIFTTVSNISLLKNSSIWIVDGTFKVVPKEFLQLYIIHGKIFTKIFPLIYILMTNKNQNDYEYVIKIIMEQFELQLPENLIMDFEVSQYNAFKKASKLGNIYFCLFHFGQCIWRKIQKFGLSKLYLEDQDFRLFLKCFSSLAFVPVYKVEHEFEKLKNKAITYKNDNLTRFVNYFEKNFVMSKKYPAFSWSAYGRVKYNLDLTTNAAELFHLHFSQKFDQYHSGMYTFIEKLKETQSLVEQDINYIMCNPNMNKNSKTQVKMEKIKALIDNYEGYCDTYFLEAIAKIYNWKYE